MILVDTSALSEPLRPRADRRVADWLDRRAKRTSYIPTVNYAGLPAGFGNSAASRPMAGRNEQN